MRCALLVALTIAVATVAAAQSAASEADMRSAACRDALAALQARESQLAAAASQPGAAADRKPRSAGDRTWQQLRARAAQACLGGKPDAPAPPPQSALPPVAVPPVVVAPPVVRPPPPTTAAPPPIEPRRPPATVMNCDPGGCWISDGTRLPLAGRNPNDPGVRCSVQGRLVVCL